MKAPTSVWPRVGPRRGAKKSGQRLSVRSDQTLLAALREAGVPIASVCAEGVCGTCETTVIAGEIDHRDQFVGHLAETGRDRSGFTLKTGRRGRRTEVAQDGGNLGAHFRDRVRDVPGARTVDLVGHAQGVLQASHESHDHRVAVLGCGNEQVGRKDDNRAVFQRDRRRLVRLTVSRRHLPQHFAPDRLRQDMTRAVFLPVDGECAAGHDIGGD